MDEFFKVATITTYITPARILFNAGSTPKQWNRKMLEDPYFTERIDLPLVMTVLFIGELIYLNKKGEQIKESVALE